MNSNCSREKIIQIHVFVFWGIHPLLTDEDIICLCLTNYICNLEEKKKQSKFQLIWTKIEGADTFGVIHLKISILSVFHRRSYQNRDLQNEITFKQNLNLTFCKKLLLLMEIFQINPAWIFGPGSPHLSP